MNDHSDIFVFVCWFVWIRVVDTCVGNEKLKTGSLWAPMLQFYGFYDTFVYFYCFFSAFYQSLNFIALFWIVNLKFLQKEEEWWCNLIICYCFHSFSTQEHFFGSSFRFLALLTTKNDFWTFMYKTLIFGWP